MPILTLLRKSFLHLCFPPQCLECKEPLDDPDHLFCSTCTSLLEYINPTTRCIKCFGEIEGPQHKKHICKSCKAHPQPFNQVAAAFEYMGPAKTLVTRLKYANSPYLAVSCAAFLALQYVHLGWKKPDYIIPVPSPRVRKWMRGFNQSEHIAHALGKLLEVPVLLPLQRRFTFLRQAELTMQERKQLSMHQFSFRLKPALLEDKRLLLLDDIWTTGSTMRACATMLSSAHPATLYGLTVCHTSLHVNLVKKE